MQEKAEVSKSWGGAREGSGRKKMDESVKRHNVTLTLTAETRDNLRAAAKAAGISASELVTRWAETL